MLDITRRLQSGTYQPQAGVVFIVNRPKYREIHAAHFRDRVVHHLLHHQLEPVFEKSFINDSFACRKGKGTHAAVKALHQKMREVSRQGHIKAYALQIDIKAFFPSMHKKTLMELLESKRQLIANAREVLNLARIIIEQDMSASALRLGNPQRFHHVPSHKRLGARGSEYGLPIGNLTSQFFGNVYLNALDQFIKRTLGVRHYVRYCDDAVLLHTDPKQLLIWESAIRTFLKQRLHLELHDKSILKPISQGVDFLGYIVRPDYLLPRHRVIKNAEQRISELEEPLAPQVLQNHEVWPIDSDKIQQLRSSWASYGGHFKHADSYRSLRRLWEKHPISQFYLTLNRSFKPRFALFGLDASWKDQVRRLSVGIQKAVLMIEVGCYVECPLARDINRLKLRPKKRKRGRLKAGFRQHKTDRFIQRCLHKGWSVVLALQASFRAGSLYVRKLASIFVPQKSEL
ncbi:MAG: reverse transcriptase/maturase family protein [Myxococcaceae bacterium]